VRTVVFGAWEPRTGACGSVFDVARESPLHELEVRGGVLPDECEDLVREFFSSRR
jgi:tRNA(adenine34) deaminase